MEVQFKIYLDWLNNCCSILIIVLKHISLQRLRYLQIRWLIDLKEVVVLFLELDQERTGDFLVKIMSLITFQESVVPCIIGGYCRQVIGKLMDVQAGWALLRWKPHC